MGLRLMVRKLVLGLILLCAPILRAADEPITYMGRIFQWVNPFPSGIEIPPGLSHETFLSSSLNHEVGYALFLPPQYATETDKQFPVVYYLHGGRPGSESRSLYLTPHLYKAMRNEETPPAIYVFVNGGVISHYNYPALNSMAEDLFIEELIPHIDDNYRTVADRSGRALQGFSQGGRGATRLMFKHAELFSSAAAGGGAYSIEKQISENNGVEFDTRMPNPQRLDFGDGNDAYTLAKEYAESEGLELEIALWGGTAGFNYDSIIDYMVYLDSLDIDYKSYFVGGVPHNPDLLYEAIGVELMNFHANAFDLPD